MAEFSITPLYSGSSGNSTLIKAGRTNILIDAGRNCKTLCEALAAVGTDPQSIDALFITHVHSDHIGAVDVFVRKYPTKLIATRSSHGYFARKFSKPHPLTQDFEIASGESMRLAEDLTVSCCRTPHDAAGSVCYRVDYKGTGCAVMTDMGYVTEDLMKFALGTRTILLESNYDERMLAYGPYPEDLKIRIAGERGHLSNDDCARMMRYLIENGTNDFILGHLSENNNTPEKAYKTSVDYLARYSYIQGKDYSIKVANRYEPTVPTEIL